MANVDAGEIVVRRMEQHERDRVPLLAGGLECDERSAD
jgi:hypothetical protein